MWVVNGKNIIRTEAKNLKIFCLETLIEGALRRDNLFFHSVIVAEKKEFLKNLCFTFIIGIFI